MSCIKDKLIVANTGSDSLTVLCLEKLITSEISLGKRPIGPHSLIEKDCESLYSVNSYDNSIYIVDISNGKVLDSSQVGRFPTHMEIIGEHIYVVNSDSNSVTILEQQSLNVIGNISVGEKPHDIKLDKVNNNVFITNHNGYSIYSIDIERNIEKEISLEQNPFHLKVIDNRMFILLHPTVQSKFSQIKTMNIESEEIEHIIEIEGTIVDMEKVEEEYVIYVTNAENGTLYEVDYIRGEVVARYKIGEMLNNIVCNGCRLYISDTGENVIIVFCHRQKRVIKKIKVGLEPSGLILM